MAAGVAVAMLVAAALPTSADSSWSQEYAVEYSSGSNYSAPGVWADKDGRVAVTWSTVGGGPPAAWVRAYTPQSGWMPAAQIATNLGVVPVVHAAIWTPQGKLWIGFDSNSPTPDLNAIFYDPGKGWGALETFGPARNLGVADAEFAIDGHGNLMVAWSTQKAEDGHVFVSTFPAGETGWSGLIAADTGSGQVRDLDVSVGSTGLPGLIFSADSPTSNDVWFTQVPDSLHGPFFGPGLLYHANGTSIAETRLAVEGPGSMVAAWVERNITDGWARLRSATRSQTEAWSEPADIGEAVNIYNTDMASTASGLTILVWEQSEGTGWVTCYSLRNPGGNWTRPAALHEAPGSSHSPRIEAGPNGEAFAVWSAVDNGALAVWGRQYERGWLPATRLSQGPHPWFDSPRVAVDGRGVAWAVWTDGSPTTNWVLARAAGLPSAEEIGRTATGGSGAGSPLWLVVPAIVAVAAVAVTYVVWRRAK